MSDAMMWSFGDLRADALPEPPRAATLQPGTVFGGRFQVDAVIGQGGMGQVYRAVDLQETRVVAIKLLTGELTEARRTRFAREGELISSLEHRGIVRVFGGGTTEEGRGFLVLEYVEEARGLLELAKDDLERGLLALVEVARAIGFAHDRGVIHRDVKSENVLVDPAGRARVCDFGLAFRADLDRLTQTGALLGTPLSMAPEQLEMGSFEPTPALDVWGLGVMLYQALTGSYPYDASNLLALARAITEAPLQPPSALAAGIPPRVEAVCLEALERRPQDRYADGNAFAEALSSALREPVLAQSARPGLLAAIGASALVVLGVLIAALGGSGEEAPPVVDPTPVVSVTAKPQPGGVVPWWGELPVDRRPALPLPRDVRFGSEVGQYVNRVDGSVLVWIPAGRFRMGSGSGDTDERPVREVELAGFFLGRSEVTWAQFLKFCAATGREPPSRRIEMYLNVFAAGDDHPVFNVTWDEAVAYGRWAGLRLPSEAEWEYAARGSEGRRYPWGSEPSRSERANTGKFRPRFEGDFRSAEDGYLYTAPVGSFPLGVSTFGAVDMCGNVWEWVLDRYHKSYVGAPNDGSAWTSPGERPGRVRRGGGWDVHPDYATATYRARLEQAKRLNYVGFRVARDGR